jgi:hypothetical protein
VPALPKLISEGGDILLFGFVSDAVSAVFGFGPLVLRLCLQVGLIGMLKNLTGAFMSGRVIFFPVVLGAAAMGMGRKVTVLSRYLL